MAEQVPRKPKTDLSKYIVNVQGKDFITFPGLLAEAHAQGLTSIDTELVTMDLNNPVMKATVKIGDRTFTGYGDATSTNVAKKVAGALIRMAETRAIARALRFACNIEMTAIEELPGDGDGDGTVTQTPKVAVEKPAARKSFGRTASLTVDAPTGEIAVAPGTVEDAPQANAVSIPTKSPFNRQKATPKTEPKFP